MIAVNDRRPITNAGIVLAGVLLSPSSAGEETKLIALILPQTLITHKQRHMEYIELQFTRI